MRDELLWAKIDRSGGPDACWPYMGARLHFGHGAVRRHGLNLQAHRMVYAEIHGPLAADQCVCHRCDNPPCCNPAHLFLGTQGDNMADKIRKGRAAYPGHPKKTHCVRGHELPPLDAKSRGCPVCRRDAGRRYDERQRQQRTNAT